MKCCSAASRKWAPALAAAFALAAAVCLLYWPATTFDFLAYDDGLYVLENPVVLDGLSALSLLQALTDTERSYWMPLTWISYMADRELFGVSATAFHRTNVLIFVCTVGLLCFVLWRMTGSLGRSLAATALVALHPQRVESVAWVAERKDVLSVFLVAVSLACYLKWVRKRRIGWYLALVVASAAGFMAKPAVLILPALLLVLDYFPLGRIGGAAGWRRPLPGVLGEKLPLFTLSLATVVVTMVSVDTARSSPGLAQRLELAALTPLLQIGKIVFPVNLGISHFFPGAPRPLLGLAAAAALLLVTLGALRLGRTRPYLAAAWVWYLIPLLPVGWQSPLGLHWIADRFTFIPQIGLAIGIAWGVAALVSGRARAGAAAACVGVCLILAAATWHQLPHWRDTEAFFRRSVAIAPRDALSWAGLGGALVRQGRYEEALRCYQQSVALNPGRWASQIGLLRTLLTLGRREEALARLTEVAGAEPPNGMALLALGTLLIDEGKPAEALEPLDRALKQDLGEEDRAHGLRQRRRALEALRGGGSTSAGRP